MAHLQVFGYVTNTNIKFIVVVDASNTSLRDNEIRQVTSKLWFLVDYSCYKASF